jgi:hypothetical protein
MWSIQRRLADGQQYDTVSKNALKAAKIPSQEKELKKLLEIYRRLSHRFDERVILR